MYELERTIAEQIDAIANRVRRMYDPAVKGMYNDALSKADGDASRVRSEVGEHNFVQTFYLDEKVFGTVAVFVDEEGPKVESWLA
jgi:hypothetical protein